MLKEDSLTDLITAENRFSYLIKSLGFMYSNPWEMNIKTAGKSKPFHLLNEIYVPMIQFLVISWYFDLSSASVSSFYGIGQLTQLSQLSHLSHLGNQSHFKSF